MQKYTHIFYRALMALSCVFMAATFVTIMLGVVAREAQWDIPGLDAYAGYAIAAALFLALPETLRHGDHIRVTLVLQRLSAGLKNWFEYGCLFVAVALSAYLAWFACRLVWVSYITHDVSPSADVTALWVPQLAMALGCIGLAVSFVEALVHRLAGRNFFPENAEQAHVE